MKFLFDDEAFSFEALRVTGYAPYGGADLGEVIVTARQIPDGDEAAWHRCWKQTAERLHAAGMEALRAGHRISARESLLRASNYYRTAGFYLRDHPGDDPEVRLLSTRVRDTFATTAELQPGQAAVVGRGEQGQAVVIMRPRSDRLWFSLQHHWADPVGLQGAGGG